MRIEPYLFFEGRCDEALAFYAEAVGAQVTMLMRYSDSPEPPAPGMIPSGSEDKVMHANVRVGDTAFMASDGNCRGEPDFRGFSLSLTVADEAEAKRAFAALGEGGQVLMPLGKTFFSPCFGMLTDRFGVGWMVIVPA
ncbi:VOC family protein [Fundidesulfovibrio agrisoli]|uniref:VOC family protein n=1 Tax=Fundidesulfovibrio agrisoli TaxID=2922717 RepID=UPI001FABDF0A|nr:VOC family protein [Fundidesulfovibrio agrisoli]